MTNALLADQLDQSIETLLANAAPAAPNFAIAEMVAIAGHLRLLPSLQFRRQLKSELLEKARASAGIKAPVVEIRKPLRHEPDVLPSLFATEPSYARHSRFAMSFLAHAAAAAILLGTSLLVPKKFIRTSDVVTLLEPRPYALSPAPDQAGGGGGGGDRDKLPPSKGDPPRFAHEQLTPPAVVVRNAEPRLTAEPTVVGPPGLTFPQSRPGDPLSALAPPSNGTGSGSGIGAGSGGGVGTGYGPGVGPGEGGGIGGGVFRVGGGVSAPVAIYTPDPEYSEEARQAKYQGTVVLWVVVDPEGRPRDLRVLRSLGLGLDEKAIEAVRHWRFEPAMKDGQPVAVQVNVEVSFHLY